MKLSLVITLLLIVGLPLIIAGRSDLGPHSLAGASAPDGAAGDGEIFVNVSHQAGVRAGHTASWEEYTNKDFSDGYMAVGQAWADYDNDGWLDLYVTGNMEPSVLYHNNGSGAFSVSALSSQVSLLDRLTGGAVWADYDNDGWRDLYVLAHGANVLFHNDGGRGFSDVTGPAGVGDTGKGTSAAWGDYDEDGYLDLYVVNWSCYPACEPLDNSQAQDRLYRNNGDGSFSDVSNLLQYEKLLGAGFTASFADYDNDGDPDIYVINDMLKNPIGNVLWRNDGPGCGGWCWADASKEAGANAILHGMGLAVGDYDNDLDLDFYFTEMVNAMRLLQNQGDGTFVDVADTVGVAVGPSSAVGWGTAFFDYNNDGWLDLFVTTTEFIQETIQIGPQGMHFAYPNYFFENNGDGTFSDVSPASWQAQPQPSMGFAYADYDQDGWVDFVLGNWNEGYVLYRNMGIVGTSNHWLSARLTGGGPVNRDAIGARLYVTDSAGRVQMQEVHTGSSLGAGNDTALHFGLGQARVSRVKVVWPDGLEQEFRRVPTDAMWQVTYGQEEPGLWSEPAAWVGLIVAEIVVILILSVMLWRQFA
jgi:hypothetical protein